MTHRYSSIRDDSPELLRFSRFAAILATVFFVAVLGTREASAQSSRPEARSVEAASLGPAFEDTSVGTVDGPLGAVSAGARLDFEGDDLPPLGLAIEGGIVAQSRSTALRLVTGGPGSSRRCLEIEQTDGGYVENGMNKLVSFTWLFPYDEDPAHRANTLRVAFRGGRDVQGRAPRRLQMGARSWLESDAATQDPGRAIRSVFDTPIDLQSDAWRELVVRIHPGLLDGESRNGGYDILLDRPELLPNSDALYWQLLGDSTPLGRSAVYLDDLRWEYENPAIATFPHVSHRRAEVGDTVAHAVVIWNTHPTRTRNLQLRGRGWRTSLGARWKGYETRFLAPSRREITETGPLAPGEGFALLVEFGIPQTRLDGSSALPGDVGVFHFDVFESETEDLRVDVVVKTSIVGDRATAPSTPPITVANFAAHDIGTNWAKLGWTSPVDGFSTLAYAIRYSRSPITDEASWSRAVPVEGAPAVATSQRAQGYCVRGLADGVAYHFAIRTINDLGLASSIASTSLRTLDRTSDSENPDSGNDVALDPVIPPGPNGPIDPVNPPDPPVVDPTGETPPATDDEPRITSARCGVVEPGTGATIRVTPAQARQLRSIVSSAVSGTTILLADGDYDLSGGDASSRLVFSRPRVTLRSESGNRNAVVLDGAFGTDELVYIEASDVTIADLTLRRVRHHAIHVVSRNNQNTLNTRLHNLVIFDAAQQAVKVTSVGTGWVDDGTMSCCHVELTDEGRDQVSGCYTGGIDAKGVSGWVVANNFFKGYWCDEGLSEHAIHFWAGCRGTIVENNLIVDCARGIGFGLTQNREGRVFPEGTCAGDGTIGHVGGVIRNNIVHATDSRLFASESGFDVGIGLDQACGAVVAHNTVVSTVAPFSSIEFRFPRTNARIINNLVSHNIRRRTDATATLEGNVTNASIAAFANARGGDLHLASSAVEALGRGMALEAGIADTDFDGGARDRSAPDVGADERGSGIWAGDLPGGAPPVPGSQPTPDDASNAEPPATETPEEDDEPAGNDVVNAPRSDESWDAEPIPAPPVDGQPVSRELARLADFEYEGAFRVPDPRTTDLASSFLNAGWGSTFWLDGDPSGENDGYPGALLLVGHQSDQMTAAISIPSPRIVSTVPELPRAEFVQPFTDMGGSARAGFQDVASHQVRVGGQQVVDEPYVSTPILIGNLFMFYNTVGRHYPSMFAARLDWRNPSPRGLWSVGHHDSEDPYKLYHCQKTAGYMTLAPQWWADRYTNGLPLLSGFQIRQGNATTSGGPALYATRPWNPDGSFPTSGTELPAVPLMSYPYRNEEPNHTNSNGWNGAAFVDNGTKYALVVVGRTGRCTLTPEGNTPYGRGEELFPGLACSQSKGYHCPPYVPEFRLYDPGQLAEVAAGQRLPWDVRFYSLLDLREHFFDGCDHFVGGIAYDRVNQRLYVTQINGDREYGSGTNYPIIHVFRFR